jgi:hypothetical protein
MTVLVGVGLLGGHALAVSVPVPTVPTVTVPTVTVPPLPVTVTTPTATVSAATATVSAPTTSASLPTVATPALPAGVVQAPLSTQAGATAPAATAGSSVAGSTPGGGSAGSTSSAWAEPGPDRTRVERLRFSRPWIATSGPKRDRGTTLTFVLRRAARVVFVVKQVSPVCRVTAHFAVNAHAGRNRIRFPGRGSKLRLDPGTYRITARTRAGQVVQRVTLVVVKAGPPTRDQIIAARAANVCALSAASASTGASNTSSPQGALIPGQPSASGPVEGGKTHPGAVLGSTVATAARAVQPFLVALLALAIFLLTVASLPRPALSDSRANQILARHRMEIAGLGAAAFVAVLIALLLS